MPGVIAISKSLKLTYGCLIRHRKIYAGWLRHVHTWLIRGPFCALIFRHCTNRKNAMKLFYIQFPKKAESAGPKTHCGHTWEIIAAIDFEQKEVGMLSWGGFCSRLVRNKMTHFSHGFTVDKFPSALWVVWKQASFIIASFQKFSLKYW